MGKKETGKTALSGGRKQFHRILMHWEYYLLLLPAIIYLLIFAYGPMYGLQIAFKDFKPYKGIHGSDFVGLKYFIRFFSMSKFPELLRNTLVLSFYSLLAGFPLPIILALSLNASSAKRYAKVIQTVTYAPPFCIYHDCGWDDQYIFFTQHRHHQESSQWVGDYQWPAEYIDGGRKLSAFVCLERCMAEHGLGQHCLFGSFVLR